MFIGQARRDVTASAAAGVVLERRGRNGSGERLARQGGLFARLPTQRRIGVDIDATFGSGEPDRGAGYGKALFAQAECL